MIHEHCLKKWVVFAVVVDHMTCSVCDNRTRCPHYKSIVMKSQAISKIYKFRKKALNDVASSQGEQILECNFSTQRMINIVKTFVMNKITLLLAES